jgi:hypothetical protein
MLFQQGFYFRREYCKVSSGDFEGGMMDRIILSALALMASAAPALAGTTTQLPEPATMTLFGLGAGGVYLVKRFIGRK